MNGGVSHIGEGTRFLDELFLPTEVSQIIERFKNSTANLLGLLPRGDEVRQLQKNNLELFIRLKAKILKYIDLYPNIFAGFRESTPSFFTDNSMSLEKMSEYLECFFETFKEKIEVRLMYEPIVHDKGSIQETNKNPLYHEGLSRPYIQGGDELSDEINLFGYLQMYRDFGLNLQVYKNGFTQLISDLKCGKISGNVALNIEVSDIMHPDFFTILEAIIKEAGDEINPGDIMFEILENEDIPNTTAYHKQIKKLQGLGISFGFDDVSSKKITMKTVYENLTASFNNGAIPEVIKICGKAMHSMYLSYLIDNDIDFSSLKKKITDIYSKNINVIGEWIEDKGMYDFAVKVLGIQYFQGFYFNPKTDIAASGDEEQEVNSHRETNVEQEITYHKALRYYLTNRNFFRSIDEVYPDIIIIASDKTKSLNPSINKKEFVRDFTICLLEMSKDFINYKNIRDIQSDTLYKTGSFSDNGEINGGLALGVYLDMCKDLGIKIPNFSVLFQRISSEVQTSGHNIQQALGVSIADLLSPDMINYSRIIGKKMGDTPKGHVLLELDAGRTIVENHEKVIQQITDLKKLGFSFVLKDVFSEQAPASSLVNLDKHKITQANKVYALLIGEVDIIRGSSLGFKALFETFLIDPDINFCSLIKKIQALSEKGIRIIATDVNNESEYIFLKDILSLEYFEGPYIEALKDRLIDISI